MQSGRRCGAILDGDLEGYEKGISGQEVVRELLADVHGHVTRSLRKRKAHVDGVSRTEITATSCHIDFSFKA